VCFVCVLNVQTAVIADEINGGRHVCRCRPLPQLYVVWEKLTFSDDLGCKRLRIGLFNDFFAADLP